MCIRDSFYPHYHLQDTPPTPVTTLDHAVEIGRQAGLKFIYTGNVPGHANENTRCWQCGKMNIERHGYQTSAVGLADGKCQFCGAELNLRL